MSKSKKTLQSNNVDVVFVGNSRAKLGFIPNEFSGYTSVNLGVGGSTPIICFYSLKRYLENNKPTKLIIL